MVGWQFGSMPGTIGTCNITVQHDFSHDEISFSEPAGLFRLLLFDADVGIACVAKFDSNEAKMQRNALVRPNQACASAATKHCPSLLSSRQLQPVTRHLAFDTC